MRNNPFKYSIATRIRDAHFHELMGPVRGKKLLDVGCGMGYFSDFFARRGGDIIGLDPDYNSIHYLKGKPGQHFAVGNAERLPFKSNSFDLILCTEVLEHIEKDGEAVAEIARVGKEGSSVLVTVPSPEGIFGSRIKNIAHNHEGTLEHHCREGYTYAELKDLLEKNGIEVVKKRYSMICLTELVMGLSKIAYQAKTGKMTRQMDILKVQRSLPLTIWRFLFPFIYLLCRMEDILLSRRAKGHMLIIKGRISGFSGGGL